MSLFRKGTIPTLTISDQRPLAVIAIRQLEKTTGASRIALHQMALLKEIGYRVIVLAEKTNSDLIHAQGAALVRMLRWPFKGKFRRFWFNRRVHAWCQRHNPALLVSHGDVENADIVFMHNCVHLASQRIYGQQQPKANEVTAIHDHVLKDAKFQRIVANSQLMARDLQARYAIEPDKLEINYPGYDSEQFNPQRARNNRSANRDSLGVSSHEQLVGLVTSGNFEKRNVALFIEIAALLNKQKPKHYQFLVVGKGDFSRYKTLAEDYGVADRFLWYSTVPDVEHLYGALDLFVLPAHIEEFGCVVLEAMACATPVIVSSWTGASELLSEKYGRLVIEDYNAGKWAERIESILIDAPLVLGYELSEEALNYSNKCQYNKLKEIFKSLVTE